jgi:hypothetical protein
MNRAPAYFAFLPWMGSCWVFTETLPLASVARTSGAREGVALCGGLPSWVNLE